MSYIGNPPAERFTSFDYQDLTGGSGTSFTLTHPVGNAQEILVMVNNVVQEPGVAYTVSGTGLTMTGSIASTDDFYVVYRGKAIQTATHPSDRALTATDGTFTGDLTVDTNTLHVDAANNRVGVGTASPARNVDIASAGTTTASIRSTGTSPAVLYLQNSDTGTGDSDGIYLGRSSAVNYLWTYENEPWVFGTNNSERGRFLAGGGLTFNGDTAAANALDDYEEGTWTPVDASSGGLTIQVQAARYRKIGSIVQVQAFIIYPTTSDGSNTAIGGLPFSSPSTSNLYGGFTVGYTTYSGSPFTILKNVDDATFSFRVFGGTLLTNNQLSTRDIIFAGTYISV